MIENINSALCNWRLNVNGAFTLTFINIAVDVSIISYDIQILLSAVFAGVDRMLLVFFYNLPSPRLLHSDRDPIPDVPAIYFVMPSEENIDRICQVR